MQHLEGSGTPVLYIGRAVFKGQINFNVHYFTFGAATQRGSWPPQS
jgi:hypothetical protein